MKKQTIKLMSLLLAAITLLSVLPFRTNLFLPAAQAAETEEHVHTPGEPVYEGTQATCTKFGDGRKKVYCTECGELISDDWYVDLPTGHQSGKGILQPQYYRAADGTYYMECVKCGEIYNQTDTLPDDYCKYCLSKHYTKLPQFIHNILYFLKNMFGKG